MYGKRIALLLVIVALLASFMMVGCSSADGSGAEVVTGESGTAPAEGDGEAAAGTREAPLALGTTAKVGDWEVTVTEFNPDAAALLKQENQFNEDPAAGNVQVMVGIKAKYVGAESGTFWTDMSYKFYGPGGNTFDSAFLVTPNDITDTGETFPNAEVAGNLTFEVPADQVEGGSLILESAFSMEDTRTFFAVK